MSSLGSIIIVSDDNEFSNATISFLRAKGYDCVISTGLKTAISEISAREFDLVISEILLPDARPLELPRKIVDLYNGLPVIAITKKPELATAIEAVRLKLAAYFIKPIDFNELLTVIATSINDSIQYRIAGQNHKIFHSWKLNLKRLDQLDGTKSELAITNKAYINMSINNMIKSLINLQMIYQDDDGNGENRKHECDVFVCPRLTLLANAIFETIKTLEKTRSSFKSKELGQLRLKLMETVEMLVNSSSLDRK